MSEVFNPMPWRWNSFGKWIGTTAAAVVMLAATSAAPASNVCLLFGTNTKVIAPGLALPVKGACASFNGYYPGKPGLLLAGEVCKSSDGSTLIFNTFTQFNGLPDSLIGSWLTSTGTGSGKECTSANCATFAVTVLKCANTVTIPKGTPGFESESLSPFLTQ